MREFKDAMKKRFAQRKMTGLSIWSLILHVLKEKALYPDNLTGYTRHNKFFVTLDIREDKTTWFHQRKILVDEVNAVLKKHDYDFVLTDLNIK